MVVTVNPDSLFNPVCIIGVDGDGNYRVCAIDTDGHLQVDVLSYALTYSDEANGGSYSTAQTSTTIWTPTGDKRIVLIGFIISTEVAGNFTVEFGSSGAFQPVYLPSNGGANILFPFPYRAAVDDTLEVTTDITGDHAITAYGWEE